MTVEISIICWLNKELRENEPCCLAKLLPFLSFQATNTAKSVFDVFFMLFMFNNTNGIFLDILNLRIVSILQQAEYFTVFPSSLIYVLHQSI